MPGVEKVKWPLSHNQAEALGNHRSCDGVLPGTLTSISFAKATVLRLRSKDKVETPNYKS